MADWLPSAISAGGNLIGGLVSAFSGKGNGAAERLASENIQLQKDFAQQGIRWRVNDAKQAGLHPLAALGAQTTSFAPINISGDRGPDIGGLIAQGGQDIARAVRAGQTAGERVNATVHAAQQLQLEGLRLDNELKRIQFQSGMARLRQQESPPMPGVGNVMPGQGNSPALPNTTMLLKDTGKDTSTSNVMPAVPDISYLQGTRGLHAVPSAKATELIEDNIFHQGMHFLRNNVLPIFGYNMQPPGVAPPGKHWKYDPVYGYRLFDGPPGDGRPAYRGLSRWSGSRPKSSQFFNPGSSPYDW